MSITASGDGAVSVEDAANLRQRLNELTSKANSGDTQALAELRRFLDAHPEIEEHVGDLARLAEASWIGLLAGKNTLVQESVKRQVAQMKDSLAGSRPTTIERLVIDLVAINHLVERQAEIG